MLPKTRIFPLLLAIALMTAGLLIGMERRADAHCQVPCGIYDDPARVTQMLEDTATIAKAATLMGELAEQTDAQSRQQFARWTATKEQHAQRIIDTVGDYFLAQKIKPVSPDSEGYDVYLKTLAEHHAVISLAMKAKQSADPAAAEVLGAAIRTIGQAWAPDHSH